MKEKVNNKFILTLAIIAAFGGFLFGYDVAVVSGTVDTIEELFNLNGFSKGWFGSCAIVGSIAGALIAGQLSDRFGRKPTMLTAGLFFAISGVACAVAPSFDMLVIARMLGGIGVGVVSIVSPLYISEIAPARQRGQLVSLYQLSVTVGILASYYVNKVILNYTNSGETFSYEWLQYMFIASQNWRAMLGAASIPSVVFIVAVLFIPESPRWFVLKNNFDRAEGLFQRIYQSTADAANQLAETRAAISAESNQKSDWKVLRSPGIFKAVIIGACIAILGQFMGVNAVIYYGVSIFKEAGMSEDASFMGQVLVGVVNTVTTIIAMFIIDRVGRKKLVYFGVSGMIISLLMISFYYFFKESLGLSGNFMLIFFMTYIFSCAISISAVIFVFLSEMYPTRVRGVAMSIAGFALWTGTFLVALLTPVMIAYLNPAGMFLLFACMCVPYMLIVWKLMPETAGKSLEEIERFWTKK